MDLPSLRDLRTDPAWRYPVLAGLVAGTYTVLDTWRAGSTDANLAVVALAGVVAGVLFVDAPTPPKRVGLRTGAVAALPLQALVVPLALGIPGFDQPTWFAAVQVVFVVVAGALVVVFAALFGALGGVVGAWLAGTFGPDRSAVGGN